MKMIENGILCHEGTTCYLLIWNTKRCAKCFTHYIAESTGNNSLCTIHLISLFKIKQVWSTLDITNTILSNRNTLLLKKSYTILSSYTVLNKCFIDNMITLD